LIFGEAVSDNILLLFKEETLDTGILATPFPMQYTIISDFANEHISHEKIRDYKPIQPLPANSCSIFCY